MRALRFSVIVIGLALIMAVGAAFLPVEPETKPAGATQGNCIDKQGNDICSKQPVFDHSNCQYPERWTNPANGCDNSDPAVPECIKAAYSQESEAACIAEYVKQYEQQDQPAAAPTPAPVDPVQTCGGK